MYSYSFLNSWSPSNNSFCPSVASCYFSMPIRFHHTNFFNNVWFSWYFCYFRVGYMILVLNVSIPMLLLSLTVCELCLFWVPMSLYHMSIIYCSNFFGFNVFGMFELNTFLSVPKLPRRRKLFRQKSLLHYSFVCGVWIWQHFL